MRNPIELAEKIEGNVIKNGRRYFGAFIIEKSVDGKSLCANAYSAGCNVNCYYCASLMRDCYKGYVPDINLKYNKETDTRIGFYSPEELLKQYISMVEYEKRKGTELQVEQFAILDCETTIGMGYILNFLELLQIYNNAHNTKYIFSVFTNGIILGYHTAFIKRLSFYKDIVNVRFSIKAGTREEFENRIDIDGDYFDLPFIAVEECLRNEIKCYVAVLNDAAIMGKKEFQYIKERLNEINYNNGILEEKLIMSRGCVNRIKQHQSKYPDYKFRFRFRKNICIVYGKASEHNRARRMKSGFYRVMGVEPLIFDTYDIDLFNTEEFTIVILGDFSGYDIDYDRMILQVLSRSRDIDEIIFLHTGYTKIEEQNFIFGKISVLIRNYMSLCNASVENINEVEAREQVIAGSNIAFYWTGEEEIIN